MTPKTILIWQNVILNSERLEAMIQAWERLPNSASLEVIPSAPVR